MAIKATLWIGLAAAVCLVLGTASAAAATSPSSPQNPVVKASDGRLAVLWEAPLSDGGHTLTGYRIEWKPSGQNWGSASSASVNADSQAYMISGLTNGAIQDVRVAAAYAYGVGEWSEELSAAAGIVDGQPRDLKVEAVHGKLKLSWKHANNIEQSRIFRYEIEWKTGKQSYTPERSKSTTNRYAHIENLTNGTVYVVRVTTMGGNKPIASSVIAVAPTSAKDWIAENVVERYEEDFPWVREAWSNRPIPVRVRPKLGGSTLGVYVFTYGPKNGFRGVISGLALRFDKHTYTNKRVVLHEMAHHYTLDHRAADVDGPIGAGWLYLNHRAAGRCALGQAYADALAHYTLRQTSDAKMRGCSRITSGDDLDRQTLAVLDSVTRGEIPDWFHDRYDSGDGTVDLDAVWADLRNASEKRAAAYQMRGMFGGYCSLREASWAIASSDASHGNPWKDGGCDWRNPQNATVTPGPDFLAVSWSPPAYEASPAVNQYVVQWRTAHQNYDTSRQAVVPVSGELSHSIGGLTLGVEYFVRVAAVNGDSSSEFVDTDGHSRVAEVTGAPSAPPGAPAAVSAVGGKNSLLVSWEAPPGGTPPDRYVVQWRSSGPYNSADKVVVRDPSARSAVVKGLADHGSYFVRVVGANDQGWGRPSPEYFSMTGAPGEPRNVKAEPRPGGGFTLSWGRPDPHYPNNPHYRPVRLGGVALRDGDGDTVPQFRYDVEYRLVGDPDAEWCSQPQYQNLGRGNYALHPRVPPMGYTNYCQGAEPVPGQSYMIRIRASYVWLNSGDTNWRNGPWAYSDPIFYNLTGEPPGTPAGLSAVGGKNSLLVSWEPVEGGTPANGFVVQWRSRGSYLPKNEMVVRDLSAKSALVEGLADHGRYHVRVLAVNDLGRSAPSSEYFAMSGAPGKPRILTAESRPGGGFSLSWERPNPYYPDNPHYRVVRHRKTKQGTLDLPFGLKVPIPGVYKVVDGDPIRDEQGHTVPQFRYDIEHRLVGDPDAEWCTRRDYRNLSRGDRSLEVPHELDYTRFCGGSKPVAGSSYEFRIRASYVWLNSGDTNQRNGPWAYSNPVAYTPD